MRGVGGWLKEQKIEREGRNKLSIFLLKCVGRGRIKVTVTKPDSLSLIPRTHMVEEKNDCSKLSSDLNMHAVACTIHKKKTCKYNRKKQNNNKRQSWTKLKHHFSIFQALSQNRNVTV